MNRRHFLSMGVFALLSAGSFGEVKPIPGATPENFVGGPANHKLMQSATSITVYRILEDEEAQKGKTLVTIDGYPCHAATATVTSPEVSQVIGALSDMNNFGSMFMCIFSPGILLRFASEGRNVDIAICFHCREMILYGDGEIIRRPFQWAEGKNSFRGSAYRAFAAIAQKAFPDDPEIKALLKKSTPPPSTPKR